MVSLKKIFNFLMAEFDLQLLITDCFALTQLIKCYDSEVLLIIIAFAI